MDEHDFVAFLRENFGFRAGSGIGDDASVLKVGDAFQLITKDILIEDVHFRLADFSPEEIALKALAVNISDIAAMGGEPHHFYLGLGFPRRLDEGKLFEFFSGIKRGCRHWQVELAGGDFSASSAMFISITMVGKAEKPIFRSGAKTEDLIAVTGPTGESALGLRLLQQGKKSGRFVDKHKQVNPEVENGLILSRFASAMIDVSDGLLIDLRRILAASKKGAKIFYEALPVSQELKQVCQKEGCDEYDLVLAGGEDYVLLFTLSRAKEAQLREQAIDYHIIGEITDKEGKLQVTDRGRVIPTKNLGYDHFQARSRH